MARGIHSPGLRGLVGDSIFFLRFLGRIVNEQIRMRLQGTASAAFPDI
jgi:hypothetical protein